MVTRLRPGVAALLLALACALCGAAAGDPRTAVARQFCTPWEAVSPSVFAGNFVHSMDDLNTNLSANGGFGTSAAGTNGPDAVFGLGQCLRDLSPLDCRLCFSEIRSLLPKCFPHVGGGVFLDGCFGRVDNYTFFGEALGRVDGTVCGDGSGSGTNYTANPRGFADAVRIAMANVTDAAVSGDGFAVGSADAGGATAFALAQCWETLNTTACGQCLRAAAGAAAGCAPATEGRALYTGCYLRYSTRLFWNLNATAGSSTSSGKHGIVWILLGSFLGAFILVLITALLAWKKGILRRTKHSKSFIDMYGGGVSARIAQSSLNFKYEELRKATNYFDPANKLGQGSNGAVYKAVLPDGKEVAVKRLFLNTVEWVDQFFNEVELISQVRHKSLVKLLGCSVNGPESLLVYQYYYNKSLELFLFDASRSRILTWDLRIGIIQGIAEGLSYLHEESETRIIHRDIKASNILLDDKYKPKITDFGLARAFGEDMTHLITGVAGTLGYMAPEYVVHGHLTEKADVFSYGVLVLEIVTGKRCSGSIGSHGGQALLTKVWNHYKDNTVERLVDRSIYEVSIRDEVLHIVQIGLLCAQANPGDRPTMTKVVELLRSNKHDVEIVLSDPPFLTVEGVEDIKHSEQSRLLSAQSARSLSGSSGSYLSGR